MRFIITSFAAAFVSTSALAACPTLREPPRTLTAPAADYVKGNHFGLDHDDVLIYDYGKRYNELGKFRNPYFVSNYAGALYRDFLQSGCKDEDLKRRFLIQADYLMSSATDRNGASVWTYPFESPRFNLKPGWISGIAQSRIAGILHRATVLTGNPKYHDTAERAMEVYELAPEKGGVATIDGDVTWMEEQPDIGGTSYKILNGHITAIVGILDYFQITGEEKWGNVVNRGVSAVRRDISQFDAGFLSYYSMSSPRGRIMAPVGGYNSLHVSQLLWLYDISSDPIFLEWASRFMAYEAADYRYKAMGSVDAKKHGPDQTAGYYGSAYWSYHGFPTWLQVEAKAPREFKGIALHSNRVEATPRDFVVSARVNDTWQPVFETNKNQDLALSAIFAKSITTDAFKIDINSNNGAKNTVLNAVIPIPEEPVYAAITNTCNFRAGDKNYNFMSAIKDDAPSGMRVFCPGWVILPTDGATEILTQGSSDDPAAQFSIDVADSFAGWKPVRKVTASTEQRTAISGKYVRVSFGSGVKQIRYIRLK